MAQITEVRENIVVVVNSQFADGNVAGYVRGDIDGLSVKLTPSQIPQTHAVLPSGKTISVPTALAKGDALYIPVAVLTTTVAADDSGKMVPVSNFRRLQGVVHLQPIGASPAPAKAAPAAPAADLPADEEVF